ncbi:prephenate dehydrogenase [bacterium M00.F.Ca.ET.228.01.1.1]|uniref:prephenate dehydrogenase n=1 Tax=Paraburkholderia phenoliruptrix TaxID=252970 RepID=UPI0010923ADF|nr:prephenate dehydrogenase [Paraburkholderia phenoliruptrix]TGP44072.1 prephenate dehydrogenase [bacterium M00.F.Ca.ET.228.01.1.1]TGS01735.1 prephenate dehydrogenase [bacterium M00.F.Ca.ET.191.01.1.1]TGT18459.1 prephenate dehydrogenase [Mesorhizobium sp. M3A.F.Ca.ET.174.01.1.1]TGU08660.1 prephenate dehydrogenase [bacterium M00.F.Ca.ET.155.01.1.1]MBW0450297.1 prephenate dehydrogenase [Paraburkholderia phenoliruptrix]
MDSKVSGTKKRNKPAGAYSGITGDDMGSSLRKRQIAAGRGANGGQPCAAAPRRPPHPVPEPQQYM